MAKNKTNSTMDCSNQTESNKKNSTKDSNNTNNSSNGKSGVSNCKQSIPLNHGTGFRACPYLMRCPAVEKEGPAKSGKMCQDRPLWHKINQK